MDMTLSEIPLAVLVFDGIFFKSFIYVVDISYIERVFMRSHRHRKSSIYLDTFIF